MLREEFVWNCNDLLVLPLHFANELASPVVEEPKQNPGDFINGQRRCFGGKS